VQVLVLWSTIGVLLYATGYTIVDWQFWCLTATYWAVGTINKEIGNFEGILKFLNMTTDEQNRIRKLVKELKELK
jgi:hypothetical protein